ncbi:DUF2301 domain-containing membrane protein [Vibrio mexicanus]|uniref:DUF2301 domain-containing membrane protein n=1 Tax=Vibrio mexicanus TaxID=1004326 RepID=UPI00069AF2E9|nr:DUF2301 domain-containing membrane protein [Vibrio mexicanus]
MVASLLIAGNLHVYNKRVRYIITSSGWIGVALMAILLSTNQLWVAYGFMFVCLSGVALKESFCFKVVGLKLVPLLLMVAVAGFALNRPVWSIVVLVIACAILGYLAYEKWKMPLHFDIGNKANYQI